METQTQPLSLSNNANQPVNQMNIVVNYKDCGTELFNTRENICNKCNQYQ